MAENKIGLKAISELLGMNFFIPSYQRGYRWDKQQVDELLDDIYSFATKKSKSEKEFYCLQPIVIKKLKEEEKTINNLDSIQEWYEVIDGQQRLTTIRIILSYLEGEFGGKMINGQFVATKLNDKFGKPIFNIEYQTRPNTKDFLDNISTASSDTMDCYFIKQSYSFVKNWFENTTRFPQKDPVVNSILNTIVLEEATKKEEGLVKVIWYEIKDDKNPIDTFIRINMGKIPLTNAELIKALFLQNRGNISDSQQTIIANEWDKIEYAFQNEEFWWFLNKSQNDIPARIEFLFDLICEIEKQKDKPIFESKYGTDKYTTFRYFNDKFSNDMTFEQVKEEWDKIHEYFLAFQEWYNTPIWYHYIGFLIDCNVSVIEIYNLYSNKGKDIFTKNLKDGIKKCIKKYEHKKEVIYCEKDDNKNWGFTLSYGKDDKTIRKLLLLFNIEFINKQYIKIAQENKTQEDDNFIIKFPFKLFKQKEKDIEHIASQTPKENDSEWLKVAKEDLDNKLDEQLKTDIDAFINQTDKNILWTDLLNRISKKSEEDELDEESKNGIGNLTLLNSDINRSYGNGFFFKKRSKIIKYDMEGKFIPICTKHVFLKYFDKKGTSRTKWGKDDIQNYQNHIGEILGVDIAKPKPNSIDKNWLENVKKLLSDDLKEEKNKNISDKIESFLNDTETKQEQFKCLCHELYNLSGFLAIKIQ